jgi:uncharacterized protein (DUF427 family)
MIRVQRVSFPQGKVPFFSEFAYPLARFFRIRQTAVARIIRLQPSEAGRSFIMHCPYKGDCTYYSIPIGGSKSEYAVWTYEKPYEAVASIKEYLALYPSRVYAIEVIS